MINKISVNVFHQNELKEAEIEFDLNFQKIALKKSSNLNLPIMIPGFIDLHVHGGGGKDVMEAGYSIEVIAKTHLKFGTTSFLATTMTSPFEELQKSFLAMSSFFKNPPKNAAKLIGVHLEGPFLSPEKLGAQPDYVRKATLVEIDQLNQIIPIKIITLAPEVFNNVDIIPELNKRGIIVQIGHSNGTYEEGVHALNCGAKGFTHLFNAMSPLHHRKPGMVGAALTQARYSELIPDLEHVHHGAIHLALKCIPDLYFVTDSTAAAGMPDGNYKLGNNIVHKCLNGVRLEDGTLAGSSLTMNQALLNLISIDVNPAIAIEKLSTTQASFLEMKDRGSIKIGQFADFVLLNHKFEIEKVFLNGELCDI
jgi:N-acetylglucosamine-6-phosphate deacetylase